MNSVFLRDSTAVTDSALLLFGGSLSKGDSVSIFIFLCFFGVQECSTIEVIVFSSLQLKVYDDVLVVNDYVTICFHHWAGWTLENVGRIFGILHETSCGRYVPMLKEGT